MLNLPLNLIHQKNKLAAADPWLVTLDITLPDATDIYLVRNVDNVLFQGRTYTAFPFEIGVTEDNARGEIPTLQLKVSNVLRTFQVYLEQTGGAVGSLVLVRWINAAHLSENYAALERRYEIMSALAKGDWISFTLGAENPLRSRSPQYIYQSMHCRWDFKSAECAYAGAAAGCDRTIDACRALSNSARFGAEVGLAAGGLRVI